jgi:rRNA biogenesis protein RRP5
VKVLSVKSTQANVQLADKVFGRIHVSQVFDSWEAIKDRKRPLADVKVQTTIDVRVIGAHQVQTRRFLPITHRESKILSRTFELSAKPSDQTDSPLEPLVLKKIEIGSSWTAFVDSIAEDCVHVSIAPKIRGKIRYLDLSDDLSLMTDVAKNFPIGSALKVHVLGLELAAHRLKLSARSASSKSQVSWDELSTGMVIPGRVTKVQERQINVQLSENISGTVGLTSLEDDYSKANPTIYTKNDVVRVCVIDVDISNKKVALSTRPSRVLDSSLPVVDPEISSISQLKVKDLVRGFVKNVADNGLFIALGPKVTGYVRVTEISDAYIEDWKSHYQVDQLVKGRVIAVDENLNHLQLSLKSSVVDKDYIPVLTLNDMKKGQIVTGKVRKVEEYGCFIVVDGSANVSGLCHRSEMADEKVEDARKLYNEGDVVQAKVLTVDLAKRKISFGLRMSYFADAAEADDDDDDVVSGAEASGDEVDAVEIEDADEADGGVFLEEPPIDDTSSHKQSPSTAVTKPTKRTNGTTTGLSTAGFDWTAGILDDTKKRRQADSDASDDEQDKPKRKKKRKPEIKVDRTGDLDANGPQSSADYERLLLGQPDSSYLWLQYMAFQLQLGEVDQARATAERALKTINIREETEKLNVWIAMLNLENTYGTDETVEEVFKRACQYNDPQEVHERLTSIYIQSGKHQVRTA